MPVVYEVYMRYRNVPNKLKIWFFVHFIMDISFAIPMFLFPINFLSLLGWKVVDPITTRMVAAALFAIGIESLISRNSSIDSYKSMLMLKIIWSSTAIVGIFINLITVQFTIFLTGLSLLFIFIVFNIVWTYWYLKIIK